MEKLFFDVPPGEWMDGLPIGNGRLAAMVWGEAEDHITLNHEWLWSGKNRNRQLPEGAAGLPLVRQYIRRGDHYMATALANTLFSGNRGGILGDRAPQQEDPYLPAGELCLRTEGAFESRTLDISRGLAQVERVSDCNRIRLEAFADSVGGCIGLRWKGQRPFSAQLTLSREASEDTCLQLHTGESFLRLDGQIQGGTRFAVLVRLSTDGIVTAGAQGLSISDATRIVCAVNMATDRGDLEQELETFHLTDFEEARRVHSEAFSRRMNRVSFHLKGEDDNQGLSIDRRMELVRAGGQDNGISGLYFDYGRYLLLSSSGSLPANLQGKWNDSLTPAWACDYHLDINLQMAYWRTDALGMEDCTETFLRFVRSFLPSAREAAQKLYGCRGICLPLQTDAWGKATPESAGWAAWIGAAAWLGRHFWEHYEYTGDLEFLRSEAYEYFRLTAEFYEDYLQEDENGVYQILPSQSPENKIPGIQPYPVLIDQSCAMDVQLCYDALSFAIRSARILGVDPEKAELWTKLRDHLPPFAIGSDGRLMEWQQEYEEPEPGHRHFSHLYGLFPGDLFTPETRPEQYRAAVRSLDYRLAHGGAHTGWSSAWTACLAARSGDPRRFYTYYLSTLQKYATQSLLCLHPPRIFQLDGNAGVVAAVTEAVFSCYDGTVHLLRGLPEQWNTGSFSGVRVPGGHVLDLSWEDGRVLHLQLTMGYTGEASIEWDGAVHRFSAAPGERVVCC